MSVFVVLIIVLTLPCRVQCFQAMNFSVKCFKLVQLGYKSFETCIHRLFSVTLNDSVINLSSRNVDFGTRVKLKTIGEEWQQWELLVLKPQLIRTIREVTDLAVVTVVVVMAVEMLNT